MDQAEILAGGFARTAPDAARAFRACLEAMARPGRVFALAGAAPPAPLSPAAGALLLTLVDDTTGLFLAPSHDNAAVRAWLAFHCGAPLVAPEAAVFALGRWEALPLGRFAPGTPEYPDRSVTLIVEVEALAPANARLTGPGIETEQAARLPEIVAFAANHARFPLGFDSFFCAGDEVSALPRSARVEVL